MHIYLDSYIKTVTCNECMKNFITTVSGLTCTYKGLHFTLLQFQAFPPLPSTHSNNDLLPYSFLSHSSPLIFSSLSHSRHSCSLSLPRGFSLSLKTGPHSFSLSTHPSPPIIAYLCARKHVASRHAYTNTKYIIIMLLLALICLSLSTKRNEETIFHHP